MLVQQLINYTLFFIAYSFIGWLLETVYASFSRGRFTNRGFLAGPFCPVYGTAALLLILLYQWLPNLTALLFLSVVVASAVEYTAALLLERVFGFRWWRYRNPLSVLHGRLSLSTSFLWGLLSILLLDVLHPLLHPLLSSITPFGGLILVGLFGAYLTTDLAFSTYAAHNLSRRLATMTKLNQRICNRREHIHFMLDDSIETLQSRYRSIMENRSAAQSRLIHAFPTLESSQYSEALQVLQHSVYSDARSGPENVCAP
ncbi:MAG: putative ABC transporter permease [Christensenellales bacterium]|jgi:uncharacterized membrane protein